MGNYVLTIDMPTINKGAEVQIAGLGTFENGKSYEVSSEEADAFRRYHGRVEAVANDANEVVSSELVLGPTILQADFFGVTVRSENAKEKADRKKEQEAAVVNDNQEGVDA